MKYTNPKSSILAGALALVFTVAAGPLLAGPPPKPGSAAPRICPPNSTAYGKTSTEWMGIYWRWYYGGADLAQSKVGNVQLMPLPAGEWAGGSGLPEDPATFIGTIEVTLPPGTPFVLPQQAWISERYEPSLGLPDDLPISDPVFLAGINPILLTIDGQPVVTDANKAAFYVPNTSFDPIMVYPEPSSYGSVAAVSFQGICIVSPPLSVGRHVITLSERFIVWPADYNCPNYPVGFGVGYENTWIITVTPH